MSMIEGLIDLLEAIESDKIAVHTERCVAVRNRNANCLKCVEACTTGAIGCGDNGLEIDSALCIGCGTCATACPTCAIELRDLDDRVLAEQANQALIATGGHPVFACDRALVAAEAAAKKKHGRFRIKQAPLPYDATRICRAPCLGRIDESLLTGLVAWGAEDISLVCHGCENCEHHPGGVMVRSVIESSRNLIEAFGSDVEIALAESLPEHVCSDTDARQGYGTSRREFLENVKDTSKRAATSAFDRITGDQVPEEKAQPTYRKVGKDGTLSHFVPERRIRTFKYLRHIGEPVAETVQSRIAGTVSICPETCTSCRMCATFCPTGAISKIDDEDLFGIIHRPSICVQCRLCETICPTSALSVSDRVSTDSFLGKRAVCVRMKKPDWTPNKPESMFNKIHSVIGKDIPMTMF